MIRLSFLVVSLAALTGCLLPFDIGSFSQEKQRALEGDPCAADADCQDGLACQQATCEAESSGCATDADCSAPEVCSDGACERSACSSDGDCAVGICDRDGLCSAATTTGPVILISETGQGMGEVVLGSASIGDTTIENLGDADLIVDAAHFEGVGAEHFFVATDVVDNGDGTMTANDMSATLLAPLVIPANSSATLFEVFQPTALGDFTVELVIHSNDPILPELRVSLRGLGVNETTRP